MYLEEYLHLFFFLRDEDAETVSFSPRYCGLFARVNPQTMYPIGTFCEKPCSDVFLARWPEPGILTISKSGGVGLCPEIIWFQSVSVSV